jgi:uncharacterized protein (TIGR03083 family)
VSVLIADVFGLMETLQEPEWEAPSACDGWRVQDVIAHLAGFFAMLAEPALAKPLTPCDSSEAVNEEVVAARRHRTASRVCEEYQRSSHRALEALTRVENPAVASRLICMGDIGSYPVSAMSEAVCFDHLCHLAHDLLTPAGPLEGPRPPLDEVRLAPALDWMLRGLPTMSGHHLAAVLDRPVVLELSGPGGRRVRIARDDHTGVSITSAQTVDGDDLVRSEGIAFLAWATHRVSWHGVVQLHGDETRLGRVLDRIRVV